MRPRHWLSCLYALAFAAAAMGAEGKGETQYMAVFLDGKKIGYAQNMREVAGGKVTTTTMMEMTMGRVGVPITIRQKETGVETEDGKPLGFSSTQDMGLTATKVEGTVADGQIKLTVTTGEQSQTKTLEWPKDALLMEGVRLLSLKKGLKEGTTYGFRMFSPTFLQAMDAELAIGSVKEVDLLGRVVKLTEVKTFTKAPTGELKMTGYVDEQMNVKKVVSAIMGMSMEMVACDKEFALSKNDVTDFFTQLLLTSPEPIDPTAAKSITYTLVPTKPDKKLSFPDTDGQSAKAGENGSVILEVRPASGAAGATFPYTGDDKGALAALKPTRYVQSDNRKIIELAKKAVGDTKDAAEAVKRIEDFVAGYINRKDLSVGYASAVEVAESKQGDCTEHAVLAAALCRALGIPAQVVSGVAYVPSFGGKKDVFGPHAWVQAYVGGKWVGLDAAMRGYSAAHITLAVGDGEPSDFFGMINTFGYFKIAKVEVRK